jgi:7,8-dihydro-6-hydroxymethylpterin-pyrophosphokinase
MTNLQKLKEEIELLSKFHQIEILKILNTFSNVTLNENNNGVFVNMVTLDKDCILKMKEYVGYVKTQENDLKNIEYKKEELTNIYFKENKDNYITHIEDNA